MGRTGFIVLALLLLLGAGTAALLHADDERGRERHGKRQQHTQVAPPNAEYAAACGECHFAYQPWLLPAASWQKLMDGLDDHFGSAVVVTAAQKQNLRGYLTQNAADNSADGRGRKMLRGLNGQTPLRITETPCFTRKHKDLDAAVFKRPSVGGAGNCPACHSTAAQGDYDDDNITVPK